MTDGAAQSRRVWVDNDWQQLSRVGSAAFMYGLDDAMTVAYQVAGYQAAAIEAQANALGDLPPEGGPRG
ncbi:hypothetical protein [Streptomyces sp. CA-106110]|uniref:hypothetical protein n=1 Tax=Streptomyces sp. CA-106110 TaxID=3240044 RepID=UPI003D944AEF